MENRRCALFSAVSAYFRKNNLSKYIFIKTGEEDPYLEYSYYTSDEMYDIINEYSRLEIGGYRLYMLNDCYTIRCPDGWKAGITRTKCVNPTEYDELVKLLVENGYIMSFDDWLEYSRNKK